MNRGPTSVLAALIATAGAARAPAQADQGPPCWVRPGRCAELPLARYVVGVGLGDPRQEGPAAAQASAQARALAAIATQLRVDVDSRLWVSAFERDGAGSEGVQEEVRTTARLILEGVELRGHWQDPATGALYLLAVLDRDAAGQRLGDAARGRSLLLGKALAGAQAAEAEGRLFEALRLLREARDHAAEVEARSDLCRLVGRDPGLTPAASVAEADRRLRGTAARVGVAVSIEEPGRKKGGAVVTGAVLQALSDRRVQVVAGGKEGVSMAVLRLEGSVTVERTGKLGPKLETARARCALRIARSADGQVPATFEREAKGAGKSRAAAAAGALRRLADEAAGLMAAQVASAIERERAAALGGGPAR